MVDTLQPYYRPHVVRFVKFHSAHVAPHGKSPDCYEKAVTLFIRLSDIEDSGVQLSWKTLYGRFNRNVSESRDAVRQNELHSSNVDSVTLFEHELDAMITEIYHYDGEKIEKKQGDKQASHTPSCCS